MRGAIVGALISLLGFGFGFGFGGKASALEEGNIKGEVDTAELAVETDWNAALTYTCGGLLSATDERVLMEYERQPDFHCGYPPFPTGTPPSPSEWCTQFDPVTGACIGKKCELIRKRGVPDRTLLSECDASGNCAPDPSKPHQSCGFPYTQSRKRMYDCWGENVPVPPGSPIARAECYSYFPAIRYSQSYYPFAYNCVIKYLSVTPGTEPRGQPSLIPPFSAEAVVRKGGPQWEPAFGSNITVPGRKGGKKDQSESALRLDEATLRGIPQVVHPTVPIGTRLTDYPDLAGFISELAEPPEVRLILPAGGLSLRHQPSALFERIFSSFRRDRPASTVTVALGSNPDALTLAAQYLEDIPLFEVRYVPLKVQAPFVSEVQLYQLAKEWETWIKEAEEIGGTTMNAALKTRIENDVIKVLRSYGALQNSIREYRLHFPQYLHALLGNVEEVNKFFSENWVSVNKERLAAWHLAYSQYLPNLRKGLRELQDTAASYTSKCLVNACRLDAVPIKPDAKPWDLLPENMELTFAGWNTAFLPEGPPAWSNAEGRIAQWHPQVVIGTPLPDLTFDFSDILQSRVTEVPVLEVEWLPMQLPYPPPVIPDTVKGVFASLSRELRPLPRLHPPLPHLTFPELRLPDPRTSLLLVPDPPIALDTWNEALQWRKKRLLSLQSTCETSATPTNFLVHEFRLYGSRENPAALRAATFIPGETPQVKLASTHYFLGALYDAGLPGGIRLPPLVAPPPCADCGTVRPQRYLRQHAQLDQSFTLLQDRLLVAVDEWNAQVRFVSVVPRNELENVAARQPAAEALFSSPE